MDCIGAVAFGLLGRAGEDEEEVGFVDAAGPALVAGDGEIVAVRHGCGLHPRGVRTGFVFGDREGLQPQVPRGDLRPIRLFLGRVAMPKQRAPIVYICAWQAAEWPPDLFISSMMTLASVRLAATKPT